MPGAFHVALYVCKSLSFQEKKDVSAAIQGSSKIPKNGEATHSGQQFNQSTDEVKLEKRLIVSL